jgi:hypothetical protein
MIRKLELNTSFSADSKIYIYVYIYIYIHVCGQQARTRGGRLRADRSSIKSVPARQGLTQGRAQRTVQYSNAFQLKSPACGPVAVFVIFVLIFGKLVFH